MMKRLLTTALVGLAGAALSVSTANAQSKINVSAGDLVLGFFATSGTGAGQDLEVDLGNAEKYITATPGQVINLSGSTGLALADITATYGAGWASNSTLEWGVIAGNTVTAIAGATIDSIWASDPETTPGTVSTPWVASTRSFQANGSSEALTAEIGLNGATSTANSSEAAVINGAIGDSYQATDNASAGASFDYFNGNFAVDNPVTNVTSSKNSLSQLDALYTSTAVNHNAVVLGTFDLNTTTGTFTFTAVPEPSSIGLTGVGFLSLIGFVALRRRRSVIA
ncbi:MAG: PEP-CTERM sorting domain-containing protein [Verrucomicrobia bacterium]|nr:PEP-CTERM sorting domain-containing protein [Verrucomicrobiota bacterium]